jgi:alkylhydroperoxidase/carboxymuconolactone decarboxylase family protein YurZ
LWFCGSYFETFTKEKRYNKLKTESKLFINIIRMIAYRAETALFNLIRPIFRNTEKEGRMIIKTILSSDADLKQDKINQTLTVTLHTQANPRTNRAAAALCQILTETETRYPGTKLKTDFQNSSDSVCDKSGVLTLSRK